MLMTSESVKVLFLMACGTAFTNEAHFAAVRGMVESWVLYTYKWHKYLLGKLSGPFSIVFGFRAFSVLPRHVMGAVVEFLRSVLVNRADIWDACIMAFTTNPLVLEHSPLVIVYRKGSTIISRTLIHSQPKDGVWGIMPTCPNRDCPTQAGDVYSKTHKVKKVLAHTRASWACKRCGRTSAPFEKPEWVQEVPRTLNYFFYDFPFESKVDLVAKGIVWKSGSSS